MFVLCHTPDVNNDSVYVSSYCSVFQQCTVLFNVPKDASVPCYMYFAVEVTVEPIVYGNSL